MTEEDEGNHRSLPELSQTLRDTLTRDTLSETYRQLRTSGELPMSSWLRSPPDSDVVLIAETYRQLQVSGDLSLPDSDVVVCVHSSDDVHDFFAVNGLGACKDTVCENLGIESAEDLKLITTQDLQGSKFTMWVQDCLTIVQQKKMLKTFN